MTFRWCQAVARRSFAAQKIKCWNCQSGVSLDSSTIFCSKCNVIQPLSNNVDYFAYFELERKFKLDEEVLKKKFHRIQTTVHPDKFGGKEENERNLSERHSSYLNQAYKTLKNPRLRAVYLLELLTNGPVEEPTDNEMASDFFIFMDEIESTEEPEDVQKMGAQIRLKISELMTEVEKSLDKGDTKQARSLLNRLRYYERAQKMLDGKAGRLSSD